VNRIIALWSVPRSVSTAFERMMRERGDHDVLFEPFASYYYFSEERRSPRYDGEVAPAPEHEFGAIVDRITELARSRPVFVKGIAYHVAHRADREFLSRFTNTFLVRHPRLTLRSMDEVWPDLTLEEAGFEALRRIFDTAAELTDGTPPVIDGEHLKSEPERTVRAWCDAVGLDHLPEAMRWEPGQLAAWEPWTEWTRGVAASDGLPVDDPRPATDPDEVVLDEPRVAEAVETCLPHYEHVARHRLT
jgi:hypothetical protein